MIFKRCLPVLFFVLSVSVAFWSGTASAYTETPAAPTTLSGGKIITARDAKTLLDAKTAIFIDVRSPARFAAGHVPGATNLQYVMVSDKTTNFDSSLDQFSIASLPQDKTKTIVFYGSGPGGWRSYKASVLAIKQGYRSVRWMRGGMLEWGASYSVATSPAGV